MSAIPGLSRTSPKPGATPATVTAACENRENASNLAKSDNKKSGEKIPPDFYYQLGSPQKINLVLFLL